MQNWDVVDAYFAERLAPPDPILDACLAASAAAGLVEHQVSPLQGALLALLVKIGGARRVLEIGTLGGYSTLWMARALPVGGRLVTLEVDAACAAVARANVAMAGLDERVDLREGAALDTLPGLAAAGARFDLVFIDADKPNNPAYLDWALAMLNPGGVIVGDNVVRDGAVADAASDDPKVIGVRAFTEAIAAHPRLTATAIQTVGEKGYDGFILARLED